MIGYKLYLLNPNGSFADVAELFCADDTEAMESAELAAMGGRAELWRLSRMVLAFPGRRAASL